MEQIQSLLFSLGIVGGILTFILVIVIPGILFFYCERQLERKLNTVHSVYEANKWRRKIRIVRIVLFFFIAPIILLTASAVLAEMNPIEFFIDIFRHDPVFPIIFIIVLGIYINSMWRIIRRVSPLSIEDVLKKNKYGLYLRAFGEDWKSAYFESSNRQRKVPKLTFPEFIESAFIGSFKDMIAVGIPNEVDSCCGAHRVYLDEDSWREGVIQLIANAQFIVVLISNKDSCIWELSQLRNSLEKTLFIVNDMSVYETVRCEVEKQIPLPKLDEKLSQKNCCIVLTSSTPLVWEFENTFWDYDRVTTIIADHFLWKKKLFHYI